MIGDKRLINGRTRWIYQEHADGSVNCARGADLARMLADALQREAELRAELSKLKHPAQATHNGERLR